MVQMNTDLIRVNPFYLFHPCSIPPQAEMEVTCP